MSKEVELSTEEQNFNDVLEILNISVIDGEFLTFLFNISITFNEIVAKQVYFNIEVTKKGVEFRTIEKLLNYIETSNYTSRGSSITPSAFNYIIDGSNTFKNLYVTNNNDLRETLKIIENNFKTKTSSSKEINIEKDVNKYIEILEKRISSLKKL